MLLYGILAICIILILSNLSLKLTVEGTADAHQGSVSLQGQYLFFHFHKIFSRPWLKPNDFSGSKLLPAAQQLFSFSSHSDKESLAPIVQSLFRGIHLHKLNLHCDISLTVYPYAAVLYGMICGVLGAFHFRQKAALPLQLEIAPTQQASFLYLKGIISLTPAHMIIIGLKFFKYLLVQLLLQTLINKGRPKAYHERASYQ